MQAISIDSNLPGGVYLCQVNDEVSCGACCGLYNVADASFEALRSMLVFRTETFAGITRSMDAILAFKQEIEEREDQSRPYPDFHHCPYIGLVGRRRSRVGCLLHPLAEGNHGVDYRGLSYYGAMACRIYFCPPHHHLAAVYKEIIRHVCHNWYLFGLVITEVQMMAAFFAEVERRIRRPLKKEDILKDPYRLETIREFLNLKLIWPFRPRSFSRLGNYFFKDRRYAGTPIDYNVLDQPPSRYHTILQALNSCIDSVSTLRQAERMLDRIFERLTKSLGA